MKKILFSMFLIMLMVFGAVDCLAAEQSSYLIYRNNDFQDHKVGDKPSIFAWHWLIGSGFYAEEEMRLEGYNNTEIVKLEKDGNSENLAVKFNADTNSEEYNEYPDADYQSTARSIFTYYPMKKKGVISFSFRVTDASKAKNVRMGRNAIYYRHLDCVDNKKPKVDDSRYIQDNWRTFIEIKNGKAYYTGNGEIELGNVSNNTWYDVDFVFDITAGTAEVYFDGTATSVALPANTVNIYEIRFDLPTAAGDAWYVDDLRIYEADGIVADDVLDAQWKRYTDSVFYTGYEFEASRAANYDYMAFLKSDGKRFSAINTNKLFDGSQVLNMRTTIHYNDDDILMVPVYDIANILGAEVVVGKSNKDVSVTYNNSTMLVTPGEVNYYIDGKTARMRCPASIVNGTICMQIEALFDFIGIDYTLQDDILWIDEPAAFDWHMPVDSYGKELNGTSELTLDENIYNRILHILLYERPSSEEIDAAMLSNVHPRIGFTKETVDEIKERIDPSSEDYDSELEAIVNKLIKQANNLLNPNHEDYAEDVTYGVADGNEITYSKVSTYLQKWAFAYLMSDTDADKTKYKNAMLHHLEYLSDPDQFRDFQIHVKSLTTCSMAYGFAYAIDWVKWDEDELAMIEDMCRRNIIDHALHVYNCTLRDYHHNLSYGRGNQALISNGGVLMLATALYECKPEYYGKVIRAALRATEGGTISYFPNGEYPESLSYWRFASDYLAEMLKGLQTSMNTDWGISKIPGVLQTAKFPFKMLGARKGYAFGDGKPEDKSMALMMFAADQTRDKTLAEFRKKNGASTSPTIADVANWVYYTSTYNQGLAALAEEDNYSKDNSTVVMKTGLESTDTAVAFHGGANDDPHGHHDIGTFLFDMSGVSFGVDLERENYNLRDTGSYDRNVAAIYDVKIYPKGSPFSAGHYYRHKGEGHNTVVANRSVINARDLYDDVVVSTTDETTGEVTTETISVCNYDTANTYDMNSSAKSQFTDIQFGENTSFAVLNMTETNDVFECAIRGIKLDKTNNIIYVQDDFRANTKTDFLWSLHTSAATITRQDNNKTAVLESSGGKKIKLSIINDNNCGLQFEVLPTKFDTTYGDDLKPLLETENTDRKYKLAVRTSENISRFKLAIAIQPFESEAVPEYIPIEAWENK